MVWVFSAGQAGKASEQGALDLAKAAGKRVLGVLNKSDQVSADEIEALERHVLSSLGERIQALVPLSAKQAWAAQQAGDTQALQASGLPAVLTALDDCFFRHIHELKHATAGAALDRFLAGAAQVLAESRAAAAAKPSASTLQRQLGEVEQGFRSALAEQRLRLGPELDQGFGRAAHEILTVAQPRAWQLGNSAVHASDEEFLRDLLDEVVVGVTEQTKQALLAAANEAALRSAVVAAIESFRAYSRGLLAGGIAERFLHEHLALALARPNLSAAAAALARQKSDAEEELFTPLAAQASAIFNAAHAALAADEARRAMEAAISEERLAAPLQELRQAAGI